MIDLIPYNTLRVATKVKDFIELSNISQLKNVSEPSIFLGEGSNVLFKKDFKGTIVRVNLKGRKIISENDSEVIVEVAAGENWHEFVTWAVKNNYSGIENLALIPGLVGAAAVGNIGAYGQEVKNAIIKVTTNLKDFDHSESEFGYRESFFKHHQEYLITSVQFRLSKIFRPETSYPLPFPPNPTIKDMYDLIVKTRTEKLPDWTKIGTAGSFFKNPIVSDSKIQNLRSRIPDLKIFDNKVPAGKLLDVLGWKGKKIGRVSTHDKSALMIINLGGAIGQEIFDYAEAMRADIRKNFEIELEYEVRII